MKKLRTFFCVVVFSFLISSCAKDKIPFPPTPKPVDCESDDEISYSEYIVPLIENNCTGSTCHNAGTGNYNYTIYEVLADRIRQGRLYERLRLSPDNPLHMPAGAVLSDCDYYQLTTWIQQGFKNN